MADRDLEGRIRSAIRTVGERVESLRRSSDEQLGRAHDAYEVGKHVGALPTDERDRVRIVCRRHADRRAVRLDEAARPACYEADHPDCEGCVEDVRAGRVETWSP